MTPLVWVNVPLCLLFIAAIVGIPYWITFKRPNHQPDHSEARAYLAAREKAAADVAPAQPAAPARMASVATRPPGRPGRGAAPGHRRPARARQASDATA
ncbi:MAG: hypothetical protein J2P33_04960 [Actinobacteria bacterium]|nr:hypothetical protein [Actinomycetota bacterium]